MTRNESRPWSLKLYVAPNSSASATAIIQARYLIDEHLPKGSTLEVIDVLRDAEAAVHAQVLAIPTLIRAKPQPIRRLIGDLSDAQKVLALLGVITR